ncbi:MAG: serine/threonine protein kinase [Deltaproteobacteria bacterium]|nr:serine/threonine protein kinase [Deltaproteobacteria bacterium]
MELLVGQSLDEHLRTHPPVPVDLAAKLLFDALGALSLAHAAGVVHRDVKPPNLFVVPTADGGSMLKVLDFGIAKVMDVAGGMGRRTRTGAMLGTPGYMSPEQIRDAKSCDARSDLWSLAVVFYEMLTHRHPFGDDDLVARAVAILRDPPRPIHEVAPHLASWDGFFATALAQDAAARFPSADAMAQALREVLAGGTVSAPLALGRPSASHVAVRTSPRTLTSYTSAAAAGGGVTHQSQAPDYSGDGGAPSVQIVSAAELEPPSVVWWGVLLIALGSFASGVLMGYLLAP